MASHISYDILFESTKRFFGCFTSCPTKTSYKTLIFTRNAKFLTEYKDAFRARGDLVSLSIPFYDESAVRSLIEKKMIACTDVLEWINKKTTEFLVVEKVCNLNDC